VQGGKDEVRSMDDSVTDDDEGKLRPFSRNSAGVRSLAAWILEFTDAMDPRV
jgi:hypothetical protein